LKIAKNKLNNAKSKHKKNQIKNLKIHFKARKKANNTHKHAQHGRERETERGRARIKLNM